jgi:hypothetical protein
MKVKVNVRLIYTTYTLCIVDVQQIIFLRDKFSFELQVYLLLLHRRSTE